MEIKDLTSNVEMHEVRGGNTIRQTSTNGYVAGVVEIFGAASNLSPNKVDSKVGQANQTGQAAAIHDLDERSFSLDVQLSQIAVGFPSMRW